MARSRTLQISLEDQLGLLAMRFRSTKDEAARNEVAAKYAEVVRHLIDSGKWKEMPSFEDMLPSDQMPEVFYIYWSIPSPIDRIPEEEKKPTILLEGEEDAAILTAILPGRVLAVCTLCPTKGKTNLVEATRSHVVTHSAPVAILFDTNTLAQDAIDRQVNDLKEKLAAVTGNIPSAVFSCVPKIEALFFARGIELTGIFPAFKEVVDRKLAKSDPKRQLESLLEKGGGPKTLSDFLARLTLDKIEILRYKSPIPQLIAFITNNLPVGASQEP